MAFPAAFFTVGGQVRVITSIRREADGEPQSLSAAIPDGDTLAVHVEGSTSVRFLGIDTPEKQFTVPGGGGTSLNSPAWEAYLTDPFNAAFGPYLLDDQLVQHLQTRIGAGAAANHRHHGEKAEQKLTELVQADMAAMGQDLGTFRFFVAFSLEVFDGYGRFLAFINRNQPDANVPGPRPLSYNERMLEAGAALPYFIWPNIDPFRQVSILEAVIAPGKAKDIADATPALRRARNFVKQARNDGIGVFEAANPLRFEAFEIRYLGRREAPNRAVIDLSRNDDVLIRPQNYFSVANPEDRLFIPSPFVPLFAARGWRLEGWF